MTAYPFRRHRSLAELAETEQLLRQRRGELRGWNDSARARLQALLARGAEANGAARAPDRHARERR